MLKGGWTPSETTRFGALVAMVDGEYGVAPNAIDDASDPFASRVRYERVEDQRGISGQLSMQWDPDGPLDVRSWVYANQLGEDRRRYDDDSYDSMSDPRSSGTFRADNDSLLAGHALHAGWSFGRYGRLKGAFQARREDFDTEGRIRDVRLGGGRFDLRDFDASAHQSVINGGIEYEVEPLRDVGLVLGYGHSFLDKDSGENDDGATFLAGSYWKLRPGARLRGSLSRKVRFPSLRQLYEPGSGNADLGAEHSWSYELGVSQELPGRTLVDLTAFWLDVDDYIETDEATGELANQDQYRFRGVELTMRTQPLEALDLLASYSFLDSENRSHGTGRNGLQNRPSHRGTFEARYRLPYGLALRGALYYVADQVVYSRQEPVRQRGTGDYFLADLRIAKTLLEERAWLYFGVDNVGDADFQESYGIPGPGRVFYGGLEGRF
ncbi:MAG TPA: TonB-dependent receptor [Myxococcota bacterium]|nr:TonB-dependent receptor [Myxococcota bacterium]